MDAKQATISKMMPSRMQRIKSMDAKQVMQNANKIIEDFSFEKYALYAFLFILEIALCFWIALKVI